MKINPFDFYNIDSLLTEDERMVQKTVRDFVDSEVLPIIRKHYRESTFPTKLVPQIASLGLLGANIKGYGCAGLNNVAYGLAMQELERGDSGLRSFVSVQGALVCYPIYTFGSDEQKEFWLPKLAHGEAIGCFGLTEHDFGSNPAGMTTKAIKKNDKYILNGTKMWITNGTLAHIAIVWAKMDNEIHAFLVPKETKGFSAPEIEGKFSMRASVTSELILEDCEIPLSYKLPNTRGLVSALQCLSNARYGISWGAIGAALACFEEALNYSKMRIQFDKPIASFQMVQEKLAWMSTEITKAQLLSLQLGRLKDENNANHSQISMAKRNNVYIALEIARMARDILGANGILDEYSVIRHMCNLETVKTYEGTHDIHTLIIGKELTGIDAFK
jgi:glutaryl-CoA dehydrogenase